MEREKFKQFTNLMLDHLVQYAELYTGIKSSGKILLDVNPRLNVSGEKIEDREAILEYLANKIFIAPDKIYPCVDLYINELSKDGDITLKEVIAGFEPSTFHQNLNGLPGPYNWLVNSRIISKHVNDKSDNFIEKKNRIRENLINAFNNL